MPVTGTRPEFTPLDHHYRVDTDTRAPRIDVERWRLRVGGMVERPLAFTLDELRLHEPVHEFVTLSCISNPPGGDLISTTRWTGVSLKRLLQALILDPAATHLRITSADGFFETVSIATIRSDERIMLAYAWDGVPLPVEHGFPLRLYVPDLYGMKQPKWIVSIDAIDRWEPGYWVARGWDREGTVAIASAIDVVQAVGRLRRWSNSAASRSPARAASRRSKCGRTRASGSRPNCAIRCRTPPGWCGAPGWPYGSGRSHVCRPGV